MNDNRDIWATWHAMGAAFAAHMDKVRAAREERLKAVRAREQAAREAAKREELERVRAEMKAEAETDARAAALRRILGPPCGAMYHNSRGTEVFCQLAKGHEEDTPECDDDNGTTWPYYG